MRVNRIFGNFISSLNEKKNAHFDQCLGADTKYCIAYVKVKNISIALEKV